MEMNIMDFYSRQCVLPIVLLLLGYANAGSPYISNNTCGSYSSVPEDFIGSICRIHIQDSDGNDNIKVTPDNDITAKYFSFNPFGVGNDVWVNITTVQGLDRETLGGTVTMKLLITDKQFNEVGYAHTIYINDVNDNSPEFQNLPYTLEIPELPCNKTIVFSNIKATDKDQVSNGTVTYSMVPKTQSDESKEEYRRTFSIDPTTGAMSLDKCLDHETNSYYQFIVVANDGGPNGGRSSTADLIIHVKDVQNKPPFFTGTYRKTINGSIAQGTDIIRVNAVDGDSGVSSLISYSILYNSCRDNGFAIDNHTGVIHATTNISIDPSRPVIQSSGHCVLTIEASEIQTSNQKQYGNTTSIANVTLIFGDIADNTHLCVSPALSLSREYTKVKTSPSTNESLSCHEEWNFENPCNASTVKKGETRFPHPNSIYKFLICDVSGKTILAQCPRNEVFHARCSRCAPPHQNFTQSCTTSNVDFQNPCSKENILAGNLTFPHPFNTNKYIRCDSRGYAWEEECFSGSFWDQTKMMCMLPEAFNPCHRRGSIVQTFFPHYCNPRLYVQCGNNGHPFVHICQKNYVFLHYDLTCSPPAFPGSEYQRYTCDEA